jgi:AcrR family transcriptional regulator
VFAKKNEHTGAMSASRTARDRVRDELTKEILAVAGVHLARDGADGLSLRAIARDLDMAPSALYRYFSGRDVLLSALILAAYESLADQAEAAAEQLAPLDQPDGAAWLAVPLAMRAWALAHPHEWALIFGSPVPGYEAPQATLVPYARLARAFVLPVRQAQAAGRFASPSMALPALETGAETDALRAALVPVAESLLPDAPLAVVADALRAWTTVIGMISLELFGHWRNTILEPDVFFTYTTLSLAGTLGRSAA